MKKLVQTLKQYETQKIAQDKHQLQLETEEIFFRRMENEIRLEQEEILRLEEEAEFFFELEDNLRSQREE